MNLTAIEINVTKYRSVLHCKGVVMIGQEIVFILRLFVSFFGKGNVTVEFKVLFNLLLVFEYNYVVSLVCFRY